MDYLFRVIAASIIGVLLGAWFSRKMDLVPASPRRKYSILIGTAYTVIITIVLTILPLLLISLSWTLLIAISFLAWTFSAWLAGIIARNRSSGKSSELI